MQRLINFVNSSYTHWFSRYRIISFPFIKSNFDLLFIYTESIAVSAVSYIACKIQMTRETIKMKIEGKEFFRCNRTYKIYTIDNQKRVTKKKKQRKSMIMCNALFSWNFAWIVVRFYDTLMIIMITVMITVMIDNNNRDDRCIRYRNKNED